MTQEKPTPNRAPKRTMESLMWNVTDAERLLGVARNTIYKWIRKDGLQPNDEKFYPKEDILRAGGLLKDGRKSHVHETSSAPAQTPISDEAKKHAEAQGNRFMEEYRQFGQELAQRPADHKEPATKWPKLTRQEIEYQKKQREHLFSPAELENMFRSFEDDEDPTTEDDKPKKPRR